MSIKVGKTFGNLTIGGYEESLLYYNDTVLNRTFEIPIKDLYKYKDNQYYSFKGEDFSLGNIPLLAGTHSTIPHNTLEGVIIWTKDAAQKDNFDNELSKLLPTIICKETNSVVRCYLQNELCSSVVERLPNTTAFTFAAKAADQSKSTYSIPIEALFKQNTASNQCELMLFVGYAPTLENDLVVLGHPLFEAYYTIFNYDERTLHMSGPRTIIKGSDGALLPLWVALIIAGVLIVASFTGVYCLVVKRRRQKLGKQLQRLDNEDDE